MKNINRAIDSIDNLRTALAVLDDRSILKLSNIRIALRHIRVASAKLTALELSLNGVPEPKDGEQT